MHYFPILVSYYYQLKIRILLVRGIYMKFSKKMLQITLLGALMGAGTPAKADNNQSYRDLIASYLYFVSTDAQLAYNQKEQAAYDQITAGSHPSAKETYLALNADKDKPFAMSIGCAMSQTEVVNNTLHPDNVRKYLQAGMQKAESVASWFKSYNPGERAYNWLTKERNWYAINSLKPVSCSDCHQVTNPQTLSPETDADTIANALKIAANNYQAQELELNQCPHCLSPEVTQQPKVTPKFTQAHQNTMVKQAKWLGLLDQIGLGGGKNPAYRISVEMVDTLNDEGKVDPAKVKKQASFLQRFVNPMLFMQHYTKARGNQFENKEDIAEFADYCAQVAQANPQVTHICPISQVLAMALRTIRQGNLPPFTCGVSGDEFMQNLADAQTEACKAIKGVRPDVDTMISHQYKPFKPLHTASHPAWALEKLVCSIAHKMYNQKFINLFKDRQDSFDALALSVYPALYFDKWAPSGSNTAGKLDPKAALESIIEMHKAFPTKDIYIVETGCSTTDPARKKEFIDMTLHACKLARELGAPVKGCYFWGHTNDKEYYFEWNERQGANNFGPFDTLDPNDPYGSVNAAGNYMQEILSQ